MRSLLSPSDLSVIRERFIPSARIVITAHRNPDGDAMGSSLALSAYLNKIGLKSVVVLPNECPDFLKWLPGVREAIVHETHPKEAEQLFDDADILICLDFNAAKRVEQMTPLIHDFKGFKVMIDHHPEPEDFVDLPLSRPEYASTCELVYKFITELWNVPLDAGIANCLYTGIMTDTGSFRYPSTTAETHGIISALIAAGADNAMIHRAVYDDFTESRMKLLGHCLSDKMFVLQEFATAYIWLSQEELQKYNFKKGDTEGIVNYPLAIRGIVFSAIFIEMDGQIKISFRSKGDFPANKFSRENFSGGGHTNAAGGNSNESIEDTLRKFIELLPAYKPQDYRL